uniref:Pyrrolidone-carboxylate peptidase n=1 Tax=Oryza nivara TaxID=4536 RepID=A0A0E0GMT5_ORYNI
MGSEGPSGVTVHVTGFKKFHGVAENPTEKIVRNLESFMEKRGLPKGLTLGSCTVLETAGQGGLGPLYEVFESAIVDKEYGLNDQGQVILPIYCLIRKYEALLYSSFILKLHFGVNSGTTRFALENQAINEATFRCPDELGWKPQRAPIVSSDGSISNLRKTTVPVNEVNKSLQQMGFDVAPSDDAGRFVCNYVYYQSLRFAEQRGIKSLFVHFPLFTTISEEVQMNFVASLLEVLASQNYAQ